MACRERSFESDTPGGVARCRGDGDDGCHRLREEYRPLQHLHPSKGTADDGLEAGDAQVVQQGLLQPDHVAHSVFRKSQPVRFPRVRIEGSWAGGAVTSAQKVGTDNAVTGSIQRP